MSHIVVSKGFLHEVDVKIIESVLPLEFDIKQVEHLFHKVNIGKGLELAL